MTWRITKQKLDYYDNSYRGKNTSVIHDTIPLIQLLLTISNSEAIQSHSEWAYVWRQFLESFGYNEINVALLRYNWHSGYNGVAWREFVISGAPVIT